MNYIVVGGVYTDLTFTTLVPDSSESYGPFETYEAAFDRWVAVSRYKVDNACHRLTILSMPKLPSMPPMEAIAGLSKQ